MLVCAKYSEDWSECLKVGSNGGHLVNPASVALEYRNQQNNSIKASQTFTGPTAHTYSVEQGPALVGMTESPWSVTPEEQAANSAQLAAYYYRIGQTATFTPPFISGYGAPAPHTATLSGKHNTVAFAYEQYITTVPFLDRVVSGGALISATPPQDIKTSLIIKSILSLSAGTDCQTISQANLLAPKALGVTRDVTILGGLDFTLRCTAAGTTTINYTLGSKAPDTSKLRVYKYNPSTNQTTDITAQVTFTTVNNKTVLSYNLTDGGALDQDGTENGTIVDPIYIGVQGSLDGWGLAETGVSTWWILGGAAVLIITGALVIGRRFKV